MNAHELPILLFVSIKDLEQWMSQHYTETAGIWIKITKKASGITSVTYDEALDVALCYGWIDGRRKSLDESYFLQKFSPRRARSLWSKRNVEKIAQLTAASRMKPSGLAEVDAAKADGRWDAAYESSANMIFPEDLLKAVEKNPKAYEYFKTLNKSNLYVIAFRLVTAKTPATRQRRFDATLALLRHGATDTFIV